MINVQPYWAKLIAMLLPVLVGQFVKYVLLFDQLPIVVFYNYCTIGELINCNSKTVWRIQNVLMRIQIQHFMLTGRKNLHLFFQKSYQICHV